MKKIYNVFSGIENKNDQGPSKQQREKEKKLGFGFYFKAVKRSFGKLSAANLTLALVNLPILLFIYGVSGALNPVAPSPANALYAPLYGIMKYGITPVTASISGIVSVFADVQVVSAASRVLMYLGLLTVLTLGISSAGFFYVLRGLLRGEHITVWNDFFHAVKKNFKQSFIYGIIDSVIIFILAYDFIAYRANAADFMTLAFYYLIILISAIYFLMRPYVYIMIVTFDLPLRKIFKNSLLLTALGVKRNIAALAASLLMILINLYLYIFLPTVGLILPFLITAALISFTGAYCAYPIIDKYMIEPYYKDHPEERPKEPEPVEPVFKDLG